MRFAAQADLDRLRDMAEARKREIREAADEVNVTGTAYYVAADGCDENAGTDPGHPWRTTEKVSAALLRAGDGVFFRRGDVFRGQIICRSGVSYGAWGEGEKPRLYGWKHDLAGAGLWEVWNAEKHIYRLREKICDCGTLVFNGGEKHARKLIPSYIGGRFVCREDETRPFVIEDGMTKDLDLFCDCRQEMTCAPSHGEMWPVPRTGGDNLGELYLRCDAGDPSEVFSSIEALPGCHAMVVGGHDHVRIDNLCIRYWGAHGIAAGGQCVEGLHVTNCEIGWIGGTIQHYLGTDPNYPQGVRGSVTRYGNGIEVYGGCCDYMCRGNYIYEVYDAGITHQVTVTGDEPYRMRDVVYADNLIERCVYSIEYFLSETRDTGSMMENIRIENNMLRFSGYGWGQQRHNIWTGAHIKSWTFENPARNYTITGNLFDRARYRLLHLCCGTEADYPRVRGNTYVQTLGRPLGQFGWGESRVVSFMEECDADVTNVIGDKNAVVLAVREE